MAAEFFDECGFRIVAEDADAPAEEEDVLDEIHGEFVLHRARRKRVFHGAAETAQRRLAVCGAHSGNIEAMQARRYFVGVEKRTPSDRRVEMAPEEMPFPARGIRPVILRRSRREAEQAARSGLEFARASAQQTAAGERAEKQVVRAPFRAAYPVAGVHVVFAGADQRIRMGQRPQRIVCVFVVHIVPCSISRPFKASERMVSMRSFFTASRSSSKMRSSGSEVAK